MDNIPAAQRITRLETPAQPPPIIAILRPFQHFAASEASSGLLLLLCTAVALAWANSPWAATYNSFWETPLSIGLGAGGLTKSLLLWIDDGLMALFFLVVGLEIKREVLVGELASPRQAVLPVAAAGGGMLVPAGLYAAFNWGGPGLIGWGIPMATDIAFSLGVLALLGSRVPTTLKIFLTALAIVDDIGAVLVITVFYSHAIAWPALLVAAGFMVALVVANRLGVGRPLVYLILGAGLWLAILESGIHATVAGVLLALTIPARTRIRPTEFLAKSRAILEEFARAGGLEETPLINETRQAAVQTLETVCEQVEAPLQRLEHGLHPWVVYGIMPLFALANAGVTLGSGAGAALTQPVAWGILAGLVVGKPLGITLATGAAVRLGLAHLPTGTTWRQIIGVACLGGIGFTMSLFIAGLAFGESEVLATAKIGILAASVLAGVAGWLILRGSRGEPAVDPA
jgi:NhaA family Na+:H+ antiporter